jgi:hypothetical protein
MAEYISCRNCGSAYCEGCNIYTLATMLQAGKFDCLMDENRSVNRFADVAPVVHGEWINITDRPHLIYQCSLCKDQWSYGAMINMKFCPHCGADMRERKCDDG